MKRIITISFILFSASMCNATGWNDYSLDIGDGYTVFRANTMDVSIAKTDGKIILHYSDYKNIGPVIQYMTTPDYIFTKNYGRKNRDLFAGDKFHEVDTSQKYYFIISKESDKVTGPLSKEQFSIRQEVSKFATLDWKEPKNPNFLIPILGRLVFIFISIPVLFCKYFWFLFPVIIATILLLKLLRRLKVSNPTSD